MSIPRLDGRPGIVALLALVAAMTIGLAPREAAAQSRGRAASMSVSVTVVRSCLVDTGNAAAASPASSAPSGQPSGAGVKLTCGTHAAGAPPLRLDSAAALSVSGTPTATHTVARTADGRVVIQFSP
jgi:hypothetical protein